MDRIPHISKGKHRKQEYYSANFSIRYKSQFDFLKYGRIPASDDTQKISHRQGYVVKLLVKTHTQIHTHTTPHLAAAFENGNKRRILNYFRNKKKLQKISRLSLENKFY